MSQPISQTPCPKCGQLTLREMYGGKMDGRVTCDECHQHFTKARVLGEGGRGRRLSVGKREQIVTLLMEGVSLSATNRITKVSPKTLWRFRKSFASVCSDIHDSVVVGVRPATVQADECWTKVQRARWARPTAEAGAGAGWVWSAIDPDSKLLISWHVGKRDQESARHFLGDLKKRCVGGFQFVTDGCFIYPRVVAETFPETGVHHIVLNTSLARDLGFSAYAHRSEGFTTNDVERHNADMRIRLAAMRRHSKTFARSFRTLSESLAIYSVHYNFVRVQKAMAQTPAMAAGLAKEPWPVSHLLARLEAAEPKRTDYTQSLVKARAVRWAKAEVA